MREIGSSSVALFAVFDSEHGDLLELAGSGTLVAFGESHYILTASHVWERVLKGAVKVGITLTDNISHRFLMDVAAIVICGAPRAAASEDWGPDLIFLRIPEEHLGTIKAYQSFYDPEVDGKKSLNVNHVEMWVLMGAPAAFGKFTRIHADIEINGLFANIGPGCYNRGDFDYYDLEMNLSAPGVPASFGGVSGGGLWRVMAHCSCSGGNIDWLRILEGVAFYQSPIVGGRRIVRCHGPKSIIAASPRNAATNR